MTLQHQEVQEPETSEVIRLAQQMYERDRAEQERRTSLAAAAEEIGIPAEYLAKATAQLKARSVVAPAQRVQRSKAAVMLAMAIGFFVAIMLSFWLTSVRSVPEPFPPVAIEAPRPAVEVIPATPTAPPATISGN